MKPGAYSDVFAFGKLCCFCLFRTTEPKRRHWDSVPAWFAGLIERCTEEDLAERFPDFEPVLKALAPYGAGLSLLELPVRATSPPSHKPVALVKSDDDELMRMARDEERERAEAAERERQAEARRQKEAEDAERERREERIRQHQELAEANARERDRIEAERAEKARLEREAQRIAEAKRKHEDELREADRQRQKAEREAAEAERQRKVEQERIAEAVAVAIKAELPSGLLKLPNLVRDIRLQLSMRAIDVLRDPLPREVVAQVLYESLKSNTRELDQDIHSGLGQWLSAGHPPPRLELIYRRWRGTDGDYAVIQRFLSESDDDSKRHKWFRDWLASTLPEGTAEELVTRLAPDSTPTPATLRDARLWLALNPDSTPVATELRLLASLHRSPEVLTAALTGTHGLPNVDNWLVKVSSTRLRDRFQPGWMNDGPDGLFIGLFIVPTHATDETLLDAVMKLGSSVAKRVLFALWPVVLQQPPTDNGEPPAPALAVQFRALLAADVPALAKRKSNLRDKLLVSDDEAFRWAGNKLLGKVYGQPGLWAVSDKVYFLGLKVEWIQFDKLSHKVAAFEAVVEAVVGEFSPDEVPEVGRTMEPRPARRFAWLLARLTDPNGTERLPLCSDAVDPRSGAERLGG